MKTLGYFRLEPCIPGYSRSQAIRLAIPCFLFLGILILASGGTSAAGTGCSEAWDSGDHYHLGDSSDNDCIGDDHSSGATEYFFTHGGNDTVHARGNCCGHKDIIYGGPNADSLHGETGDDAIHGEDGFDTAHGGRGEDNIKMGDGADIANGDDGDDRIYGGDNGNDGDRLKGQEDRDTINDVCCGDIFEKDYVCGQSGHDTIDVDDGDEADIIWDPSENDSVRKDPGDARASLECGV